MRAARAPIEHLSVLLTLCVLASAALAQGLGEEERGAAEQPSLPAGLGEAEGPAIPEGLAIEESPAEEIGEAESVGGPWLPFDLSGFFEVRAGLRTRPDPYERDSSLGESRLQLEAEKWWTSYALRITADLLYDPVFNDHDVRLEQGRGWVDLREANVSSTPLDFLDLKVGRQILTWGTGDMLFINDLFPKDWNSFFIGRDPEYLKAPSDAVKASLFGELANLDLVYVPRFDADRFIDGRRLSYWNDVLGRRAGRDAVVLADRPRRWFEDDEVAARLYKDVEGYKLALYAYRGFWKSPGGADAASGRAIFPELHAYGGSVRGKVLRGIGNVETGYYRSADDLRGSDPFVKNGEVRVLVGYEQELARDFTGAVQYYLEHMTDYRAYRLALPTGFRPADENRHVVTLRLTKLLMNQNLALSLFAYYSPSDDDAYLRPRAHYKVSDRWSAEVGGNVFIGEDDHTFFGQFERNNNVYVGLRHSF